MTMAPFDADSEELNEIFSKMNEIHKTLSASNIPHMPFTELSMGMSGDYVQAIQHGATFVRVGSAFFTE